MGLYRGTFQPPAVPASTSGPPAWVLLNTLGYIGDDGDNATRAEALTSTGQPIAFSFFPAEPPGVSHFCVHCRGLENAGYSTEPEVVHSAGNLALLTICLKLGRDPHREYFLYRASRGGQPQSLEPIPGLHPHICNSELMPRASMAVVPCDGEHFVLAALSRRFWFGPYDFHVFRSKLGTWTEKVVELLPGEKIAMDPDKVIVLGGGAIGWVDLWRGILVCNLLDDDPVLRAIPLPTLLPVNRADAGRGSSAEHFRDVVCVDGVIRLVEIQHCRRRVVRDVSELEVLHDQDLTSLSESLNTEPKDTFVYTGWRLLTWNRTVSSKFWRRESLVDDVVIADNVADMRLPGLLEKNTRKKLRPGYPTLSTDGTDVVYLITSGPPR